MVDPFYLRLLAGVLRDIERADTDYEHRERLVWDALFLARRANLAAGFRLDPDEPCWPVAFIELPTGQVSWHMPEHRHEWDGHDVPTKYERCRAFIAQQEV